VEALQAAAQASLEWFEGTERMMHLPPAQFAYHLMTRSLRVSHASMRRRDPELAAAVEQLLVQRGGGAAVGAGAPAVGASLAPEAAQATGAAVIHPRQTPVLFCDHRVEGRAVRDETSGGRALAGESLPSTDAASSSNADASAYGARLVLLSRLPDRGGAAAVPMIALLPERAGGGAVAEAHELRRFLSSIAPAAWRGVVAVVARTPDELAMLYGVAPQGVAIGLELIDDPSRRDELTADVADAMQRATPPAFALVRPAAPLPRSAAGGAFSAAGGERMAAVPLADRVRNELSLPTMVCLDAATRGEDLDAVIAAGRADLVVLPRDAALFRKR
jgi:hypothetical protein